MNFGVVSKLVPPKKTCFHNGKEWIWGPSSFGKYTYRGSLYYQPKQCTIKGKSLKIIQNYHTYVLFDSPEMGNLMTSNDRWHIKPIKYYIIAQIAKNQYQQSEGNILFWDDLICSKAFCYVLVGPQGTNWCCKQPRSGSNVERETPCQYSK